MQTSTTVRVPVAICCGHRLFRDVLVAALSARPEFAVVGDVGDPADLPSLCRLRAPELVLCYAGEALGECVSALAAVRRQCSRARLVLIYRELSGADLATARQAGVDTVIPCTHGLDALLRVLGQQHAGGPEHVTAAELTEREQDIVDLLAAGHPVVRIAGLLGLDTRVVENHKRRIYQKLAVSSQGHLAARAAALGLVARPPVTTAEPLPELTVREADILRSIARGDTVRQTARSLGIAEKTVENTQARLFRKLGARNRAGALATAHALGLLELLRDKSQ
ncbi:LuxR family transcriptional regulator [Actinoplanes sp. NPDC051513]|uniref:LuxR family transcriptional regulator n=1 Tax=Actinoplanes sp. NPDC051513 TaxID=3363908 RepID=UPI0037A4A419